MNATTIFKKGADDTINYLTLERPRVMILLLARGLARPAIRCFRLHASSRFPFRRIQLVVKSLVELAELDLRCVGVQAG